MSNTEFWDQVTIPDRQLGPDCPNVEDLAFYSEDLCAFVCSDCGATLDVFTSDTSELEFYHCPNCLYIFAAEEGDDGYPDEHVCRYNVDGECEICGNVRYNSSLSDELSGV